MSINFIYHFRLNIMIIANLQEQKLFNVFANLILNPTKTCAPPITKKCFI